MQTIKGKIKYAHTLLVLLAFALQSCGGGGGDATTAPATVTLSGTAATGAPIASATITFTGTSGGSVTSTTGTDGKYTANVASLAAPYLLKITSGSNTFYSVGNAEGTVNIHPYTDLIIRTYYKVQGTTVDAAFVNPSGTNNAPPSVEIVNTISAVVKEIISPYLSSNGIDPATFNLITSTFNAGSANTPAAGFDTLLASSMVTPGGLVTITVGGTVQTTTVTVDDATDTTATNTSVTVNGVVISSSFTSTVIATDAATKAAVSGVLTTFSNFSSIVNTKGNALTGADLTAYFDTGYVGDGFTALQEATGMAAGMAGATIQSLLVDTIRKFDPVNNIIEISGLVTFTNNGLTATQRFDNNGQGWFFKKQVNGSWLFYGNQQRARAKVGVSTIRNRSGLSGGGGDGVYYKLKIELGAPTTGANAVTSATVSGQIGGTQQTKSLTKRNITFNGNGISLDQFILGDQDSGGGGQGFYNLTSPALFPLAGTAYTFVVTFADASQQTYTKVLGSSTSEAFDLQAGVETTLGHSVATALGSAKTLSWNLPTTFPIFRVEAYGFVTNTLAQGCAVKGPQLAVNATSVTMTLPTTCNGIAIDTSLSNGVPSISIVVEGSNGQKSEIWYGWQNP